MMTRIDQEPVTTPKPLCPRSFTPQHHNVPDPLCCVTVFVERSGGNIPCAGQAD
jgi:hypothetical protein